ncbi:hypothetical protein HC031_10985 [Planosporangium thailandense]|uniref:Uncharacterized protein n=1 Tax=Planosporangium thailandense TaxID=765197 RepID=A0ABX0XW20_9ACTN|nr:hypothetical protein [Planosporangium thailandense]NJC70230.1 hypothetical protein [Planosporangium thailandense]
MLLKAIPSLATEPFVIRSPEARCRRDTWDPAKLHDGRVVQGDDLLRLVGDLLEDACFWCELQSDHTDVHVSEEAVYLGFSSDQPGLATAFHAEPVTASPYADDDMGASPYRPASTDYWMEVERLLDRYGSLTLLSQWAAGIGGEQWYHVRSAADLAVARREVVARSVLAAFAPAHFVVIGVSSEAEVEAFIGGEPLYGNLRWLAPGQGPKLVTATVDDENDLRDKMSVPRPGTVLLSWPEDDLAGLLFAACPDEDGVVRTTFRFG